jgi:hypothetical protein
VPGGQGASGHEKWLSYANSVAARGGWQRGRRDLRAAWCPRYAPAAPPPAAPASAFSFGVRKTSNELRILRDHEGAPRAAPGFPGERGPGGGRGGPRPRGPAATAAAGSGSDRSPAPPVPAATKPAQEPEKFQVGGQHPDGPGSDTGSGRAPAGSMTPQPFSPARDHGTAGQSDGKLAVARRAPSSRAPRSARQLPFPSQPADAGSDNPAARLEPAWPPAWPPAREPCPHTWIFRWRLSAAERPFRKDLWPLGPPGQP